MKSLIIAAVITSLFIAGCVVERDILGTASPEPSGGATIKASATPHGNATASATLKATASIKPKVTPTPSIKPRCLMTAEPWLIKGPAFSTISAFFENLPVNVTNATVKCNRTDKGINQSIIDNKVIYKCKFELVQTQTNEIAVISAGGAVCNASIVIDPKPGPEIMDVLASWWNATAERITWKTSQDANGKVNYGTTGSLSSAKNETGSGRNHEVIISKLNANATYFYKVTSCLSNGGCTQSDVLSFSTKTP